MSLGAVSTWLAILRRHGPAALAATLAVLPLAAAHAESASSSSSQRSPPPTVIGGSTATSAPHLGGTGLFETGPAATALGSKLPPVGTPRSVPPNTFPGLSFNPNSTGVIGGGATVPVGNISGNSSGK